MLITNELMERLEKVTEQEVTLAKVMKDKAKIAVDFARILSDKYRFKANEDKILIASESIKNESVGMINLKIYYTYSGDLVIKSKNEPFFQVKISDIDTLYYCLLSMYFFNNCDYEFDKRVNTMYHDEKLSKIGLIICDIYSTLI